MESTTSTDGTEIAFERRGDGTPVVLVHGGSGSRHSWDALAPHLAEDHEVITYDRRGRGDSGDAEAYDLDREVDDLRAVLDAVDGDPDVFGHSFGGLVALEAARELSLDRLVLYEPAILPEGFREGADLAARMRERIDAGDRRGAVETYYREVTGADDLSGFPVDHAVAIVETMVRENRAIEGYSLADDLDVGIPTLLVTGEYGPPHLRASTRSLHDALPESRLVELRGVGHVAIDSAPERLAREVRAFLAKPHPS